MKAEAKRQRLSGDATRTTDAEHTTADARAAGQRTDQLKATCDDPARARTALAPYEAGVTEEVRHRGREERPERKRTKAEAKHQRQAAAVSARPTQSRTAANPTSTESPMPSAFSASRAARAELLHARRIRHARTPHTSQHRQSSDERALHAPDTLSVEKLGARGPRRRKRAGHG